VATIGGQGAIKASFAVTDGGSGDADGTADGIIVDPTGLALPIATPATSGTSGGLASTGENITTLVIISLLAIGSAVATSFILRSKALRP
jgi:hypothetical protein